MKKWSNVTVGLAVAIFGATHVVWAQNTSALGVAPVAITARNIQGTGGWQADGQRAAPTQRWSLQLARANDNSISGRVTLSGSPLAGAGNVQGHIVGSTLMGTIVDDAGLQVATFRGTVSNNGMSGTYTDRTGETGAWAWDGPPPQ